jgi:hypothetical protein
VVGSLYLYLAKKRGTPGDSVSECECFCPGCERHAPRALQPGCDHSPGSRGAQRIDQDNFERGLGLSMQEVDTSTLADATPGATNLRPSLTFDTIESVQTTRRPTLEQSHQDSQSKSTDEGKKQNKIRKVVTGIGEYFGTAAYDRFDDSEFKEGYAGDYPELPGEQYRNPVLSQIREQYNPLRDAAGNATPSPALRPQRSRGSSPSGSSVGSGHGIGGRSISPEGRRVTRRDTLEVPSPVHLSHSRSNSSNFARVQPTAEGASTTP